MTKRSNAGVQADAACGGASVRTPEPAQAATIHALEAHRSTLQNYFRRRVRRTEDAEDFVQDVYLRVLSAGPEVRKVESWRGFLLRAASNLLIDKHRRSKARMEGEHVAIEGELCDHGIDDPERVLIGRDQIHALSEGLKTLTSKARDAFLLVRVEGLSHKEAAARMGIEPKAVSRHIERSLAQLGALLADVDR
jgi:RNA polymerase sigma-70 factor (ECF subfamily)